MNKTEKGLIGLEIVIVLFLLSILFIRVAFFTFVDNYEFGYKFNARTGEITELNRTGYIYAIPLVNSIHTIDTRPFQVNISQNSRVLNAKLIRFNPKGYRLFLSWHGRGDYDQMSLSPILSSYAFDPSGEEYPFLSVDKELSNVSKNDTIK